MEFIQHEGKPVAVLALEDLSADENTLAALIDEAINRGCSAFILPSAMVKHGLSMLGGGLIEALRQRFTDTRFKAVIAGPLPTLTGLAVKSLVKAYGVGDSVFFADSMDEALDKLA